MKEVVLPAQKRIGVVALSALLARETNVTLIDVRTPGEFAAAHIGCARLHPLADLEPAALLEQPGPEGTIYVICQTGLRAAKAIERLEEAGLINCVLVEGGMDAWIQAGLPTVHGKSAGISILRQVQITIGSVCAGGSILALVVDPLFVIFPLLMGCGLLFAGLSGPCGLALLLSAMPWNRARGCEANVCSG
jgi:rhodanese-related sulfurtransferase